MKAIDMTSGTVNHLKALVYGRPGTGKTNFGVSAPRPLILLSEGHAAPHVRAAAIRMGRPVPNVLFMEEANDYRDVLRALHGSKDKPFVVRTGPKDARETVLELEEWPETVVLDSVTDAMQVLIDEIRLQSPPKEGKDGLPVDSERFWGALTDRATGLIRAFRDAPLNVLFLALLDDRMVGEGDEATRWVGPSMPMRKLPGALQAAVNVVGITYRTRLPELDENGDRMLQYGILTTGPDFMELKPCAPLRDRESTDFADWVRRWSGDTSEPLSAPPAPPSEDDEQQGEPGASEAPEGSSEAPESTATKRRVRRTANA